MLALIDRCSTRQIPIAACLIAGSRRSSFPYSSPTKPGDGEGEQHCTPKGLEDRSQPVDQQDLGDDGKSVVGGVAGIDALVGALEILRPCR